MDTVYCTYVSVHTCTCHAIARVHVKMYDYVERNFFLAVGNLDYSSLFFFGGMYL